MKATVAVSGEASRQVRMSLEVRRRFLPEIGVALCLFALALRPLMEPLMSGMVRLAECLHLA